MKRKSLLLTLCILLVALVVMSCDSTKTEVAMAPETTEMSSQETTMAGDTEVTEAMAKELPHDFSLMNLKGETVTLSSFNGKPVYIKFWASWCSICLAGLEDMDALSAEDNGFEVITIVSPDYNGEQNEADFKTWFAGLEYKNINVLLDVNGDVSKVYGVRAYPTSAFIDKDGQLLSVQPGHLDKANIEKMFE